MKNEKITIEEQEEFRKNLNTEKRMNEFVNYLLDSVFEDSQNDKMQLYVKITTSLMKKEISYNEFVELVIALKAITIDDYTDLINYKSNDDFSDYTKISKLIIEEAMEWLKSTDFDLSIYDNDKDDKNDKEDNSFIKNKNTLNINMNLLPIFNVRSFASYISRVLYSLTIFSNPIP